MSGQPLRLMVFDRSATQPFWPPLPTFWRAGGWLYQHVLRRFDAYQGIASWPEAFTWLAAQDPSRPIGEIQFWGHGKWGSAKVGGELFDVHGLTSFHPYAPLLDAIKARLLPGGASLFWFRTCETFGADVGQIFARDFSDRLGTRTAGHTFEIGFWQSGLHSLEAGTTATWAPDEGLEAGSPSAPLVARTSRPWLVHTISCLQGHVPPGY